MKGFESGVAYLRKESLKYGLIKESDNDDKLIERLAKIVRGQDPFDGNTELAEEAEQIRREALDAQAEKTLETRDETLDEEKQDEPGSDKKSK